MWKTIAGTAASLRKRVVDQTKPVVKLVEDLSRPVRVAAHAAKDLTRTKAELIAENALLRQQLIAAKRQINSPRMSKPEKLAMTLDQLKTDKKQITGFNAELRQYTGL